MIINKRYTRSLRKNIVFYVSSSVLTAVSVFIFLTMFSAGVVTQDKINGFFSDNKVEDFEIITMKPITDEEIEEIEDKYLASVEKNVYANFDIGEKQIRVFEPTSDVNKYCVIEGDDISDSEDILLSKDYALENDISIGDNLKLGGKEFKVCGYASRPDYIYMLRDIKDNYVNKADFGIAIAKEIPSDECSEYYSIICDDDNVSELRKYIDDNYTTISYMDAENNQRIRYARNNPKNFILMSVLILPVLLLLVMIMVSVVLMRMIKDERKIIGTLIALGYRKKRLKLFYSVYAVIPAVTGTLLGILSAYLFIGKVSDFICKNFENIFEKPELSVTAIVICVVLPVILYTIAAYIEISKVLRKNVVLLLQNRANGDKARRNLKLKNLSFSKKFRLKLLWNNKIRSFTVLLGVIISCLAMEFGFICNNSTAEFIDTSIDKIGKLNNQYYLTHYCDEGSYDGEEYLLYKSFQESENDKSFSLIGVGEDNKSLDLKDTNGDPVSIGNGYYITEIVSLLYGLERGDVLKFYNPASLESYEAKIDGIIDNPVQAILYTSEKNARNIIDAEEGTYNLILSDEKLDIPDDDTAASISKDSLKDQLNTVLESTNKMIIMMIGLGIILCVMVIFMMVNMIIDENKNNISMLKVLGYSDKKINKLVLNVNHILVPIGMLLSVPLSLKICDVYFSMMIEDFACHIPAKMNIQGIIICFAVLVISYFSSLFLMRKKVGKVRMTDSLKEEH